MSWTENYWEIVDEFYWVPSYLGLKSIPQKYWKLDKHTVTMPRVMTNSSGPLYRRIGASKDHPTFVRRQEETFNHIFNLALSIVPGEVVSHLFGDLIGVSGVHDYKLVSNSVCREYPWISGANVTTPDSFLLSTESTLAIEIKFNAKTSLDQLAKYVALIAGEEVYGDRHEHLSLLYIYPSKASEKFQRQTSLKPEEIDEKHFSLLERSTKNRHVKSFFGAEPGAVIEVLSRLTVSCVTWAQILDEILAYTRGLGDTCGERTLKALLDGLASEVAHHPLTGVRKRELDVFP